MDMADGAGAKMKPEQVRRQRHREADSKMKALVQGYIPPAPRQHSPPKLDPFVMKFLGSQGRRHHLHQTMFLSTAFYSSPCANFYCTFIAHTIETEQATLVISNSVSSTNREALKLSFVRSQKLSKILDKTGWADILTGMPRIVDRLREESDKYIVARTEAFEELKDLKTKQGDDSYSDSDTSSDEDVDICLKKRNIISALEKLRLLKETERDLFGNLVIILLMKTKTLYCGGGPFATVIAGPEGKLAVVKHKRNWPSRDWGELPPLENDQRLIMFKEDDHDHALDLDDKKISFESSTTIQDYAGMLSAEIGKSLVVVENKKPQEITLVENVGYD